MPHVMACLMQEHDIRLIILDGLVCLIFPRERIVPLDRRSADQAGLLAIVAAA